MKKGTLLLLLIICFFSNSFAQTTFQQAYGGIGQDVAYSVIQTADGGYIMNGYTRNFGPGTGENIYLVKTNSTGDQEWANTYGGALDNESAGFCQTYDGGFILGGSTSSFSTGDEDFYLVKTDANGDTIWSKTYGTTEDEYAYSVQQTSDSGFIITGYSTNGFGLGISVVKTNSTGDTLWTKNFGVKASDNVAYCVRQTRDGGYIIAGYTAKTFDDVYLIKTDANGDTLWTKTYGGPSQDVGYCISETTDGGFIVGGYTNSFGGGGSDIIYVFKTDSAGGVLWSKTYGVGIARSIQQTMDGGFVITGSMTAAGMLPDAFIIRTDAVGDTLWSRLYGSSGTEVGYSIQQTPDSGFIVAGNTSTFGVGSEDFYLIKTDANGNVSCNARDTTFAVGSPATKTNRVATQIGNPDSMVVKSVATQISGGIAQTTICLTVGTNQLTGDTIISLFPNPVRDEIHVGSLVNTALEEGSLAIYNMLGEKVMEKKLNSNDPVIPVQSLSAGLYLLYITKDSNRRISKFVKE